MAPNKIEYCIMIKYILGSLAIVLIFMFSCSSSLKNPIEDSTSFYDLKVRQLNSEDSIDFSSFKGKKVLLVNVASKCGFTYQYEGLEKLYEANKENLVIVGLPCNQFLFQEPAGEDSIASFCSKVYNVSFPLSEKIYVKGKKQHPIYQWLTKKSLNKLGDFSVSWNFNKFLVDEEGNLIAHFDSKVKPQSEEITKLLK